MNRLKAKAVWPVMKEFAKGREVQMECPHTSEWLDVPNPTFAPEIRWRVKPEDEEFNAWWGENFVGLPMNEKKTALKAWVESKKRTLNGN